mgnify:CR=1 FL=1
MYSLHTHINIISLHSESMWNTYTNKINSKQIDMTSVVLKQIKGELSKQDVEKIITNHYKSNQNV